MIYIRYQHVPRGGKPEPPTEVERAGCNFCNTPLPRKWTNYPAATFSRQLRLTDGGSVHIVYAGTWESCKKCAPLVDTANWPRLAARMVATNIRPAQLDNRDMAEEIQSLLAALARHIGAGVAAQRRRGHR